MRRLHTLPPFWKLRTSGSRPQGLPTRIDLVDRGLPFDFVPYWSAFRAMRYILPRMVLR